MRGATERRRTPFSLLPPDIQRELSRIYGGSKLRLWPGILEQTIRLGVIACLLGELESFLAMLRSKVGPKVANWAEAEPAIEREIRARAARLSKRTRARIRSAGEGLPKGLVFARTDEAELSGPARIWLNNLWVSGVRELYVPMNPPSLGRLRADLQLLVDGGATKRKAILEWCRRHLDRSPKSIREAYQLIGERYGRSPETIRRRLAGLEAQQPAGAKNRRKSHSSRAPGCLRSSRRGLRRAQMLLQVERKELRTREVAWLLGVPESTLRNLETRGIVAPRRRGRLLQWRTADLAAAARALGREHLLVQALRG